MPLPADEITKRILTAFPDAAVHLVDLAGDNDHWQVTVTSPAFTGLPRVKQHQLVYEAIGGDMGTRLHALSVMTKAV
jgi:stress-induced morphogen